VLTGWGGREGAAQIGRTAVGKGRSVSRPPHPLKCIDNVFNASLFLSAVRRRCRRSRPLRPSLPAASEGAPVGRMLDRLHHRGRGRPTLQPGHPLLRRLVACPIEQVRELSRHGVRVQYGHSPARGKILRGEKGSQIVSSRVATASAEGSLLTEARGRGRRMGSWKGKGREGLSSASLPSPS